MCKRILEHESVLGAYKQTVSDALNLSVAFAEKYQPIWSPSEESSSMFQVDVYVTYLRRSKVAEVTSLATLILLEHYEYWYRHEDGNIEIDFPGSFWDYLPNARNWEEPFWPAHYGEPPWSKK